MEERGEEGKMGGRRNVFEVEDTSWRRGERKRKTKNSR